MSGFGGCKELKLPNGPKGKDGANGIMLKDYPIGSWMMLRMNVTDFQCLFPNGVGLDPYLGWFWENGQNGTVDARGRFPVCFDDQNPDYQVVGASGGSNTKTLVTGNLPAHNHSATVPDHFHSIVEANHTHTAGAVTPTITITEPGGPPPTGHFHTLSLTGTNTGSNSSGANHSHAVKHANPLTVTTSFTSVAAKLDTSAITNAYVVLAGSPAGGLAGDALPVTTDINSNSHTHPISSQNISTNPALSGVAATASPATPTIGQNTTPVIPSGGTQSAHLDITVGNTGSATPVDIRPAYTVLISIVKLA